MNPSLTVSDACDPSSAKELLLGLIEQALESSEHPRAVRVEIPIKTIRPLDWLREQPFAAKVYWMERGGTFEAAGAGIADVLHADADPEAREQAATSCSRAFAALQGRVANGHANLRYYGGVRFGQNRPCSEAWSRYGEFRFVLPRFELLSSGDQTYLACNALGVPQTEREDLMDEIRADLAALVIPDDADDAAQVSVPALITRRDMPDHDAWTAMINRALDAFDEGQIDKVVLARETELTCAGPLDPLTILARLTGKTQRSFHFCFQLDEQTAFLGATPELLFKRQDRYVQSEAVAGTCARASDPTVDEALGQSLLQSEKDRREHKYVVDTIRSVFDKLCHAVHGDRTVSLLKLARVQHLFYRLEGILTDSISDADILNSLHPTPAVGGFPTAAALRRIAEWEPFDRGWYAGPVGWVGPNAAVFAVGIRSGLIHGDTLHLFAGAGIVAGSNADREWSEIENKMDGFLSALVDEPSVHDC